MADQDKQKRLNQMKRLSEKERCDSLDFIEMYRALQPETRWPMRANDRDVFQRLHLSPPRSLYSGVEVIPRSRAPSLQLAIQNVQPDEVEALLTLGVHLAYFVFPAEHFAAMPAPQLEEDRLHLVSGLLACVELLVKKGYELTWWDALTIAKLCLRCEFLDRSANLRSLRSKLKSSVLITHVTKKITIKPGLSVYDLIYEEPDLVRARGLTATDCYEFTRRNKILPFLREANLRYNMIVAARLGQILAREFCHRWRTILVRKDDEFFSSCVEAASL